MTIDKHLQLSVLSAPVACVDRRSLSQAWYSALYGSTAPQSQHAVKPPRTGAARETREHGQATVPSQRTNAHASTIAVRRSNAAAGAAGNEIERRAPRTALTRRIERALRVPSRPPAKASITLEGGARVQLLVRACGSNVKLVAICSPKARAQVAQALVQARYALALRGVDLEPLAREDVAC